MVAGPDRASLTAARVGDGSQDAKARLVSGRLLVDLHRRDDGTRRAAPAPRDHALDRLGRAFETRLNLAVHRVAHPTVDAADCRLTPARITKEHTLHAAAHDNSPP